MVAAPSVLKVTPLSYPASAAQILGDEQFGVIVEGVKDMNHMTDDEFAEIEQLLYTHSIVLFPDAHMTPAGQHALTNKFDPGAGEYGHGNKGDNRPDAKSVLHPDLRTIPGTIVQLIGNGVEKDPTVLAGLDNPTQLKHPSHQSFHKTIISEEDSAAGFTRFYRWHIDAALYERDPPKVTTLYGLHVPQGPRQTVRYDDGTGDELDVPLGGTSFVSGKIMFDILPANLKSVAIRSSVTYSPHPYVKMSAEKSKSTGLGMETDGHAMSRNNLPPYEDRHIKTYPLLWKNPVTSKLHFQVHPSGVEFLHIDPLPAGVSRSADALYPDGAHLTDLKEVRELIYQMQRPGIAPSLVYTHDWRPYDLALFHNRGVLHSITGAFKPEENRAFWQCNLASTDAPEGPSAEDIEKYA